MAIEVLFFDVGNTLIYPDPPVGEVYADALREAGFDGEPADVERRFNEAWRRLREERDADSLEYGRTEQEALRWWRRVVAASFEPFGQPTDFERTFRGLYDYFASGRAWGIYEDAVPTVEQMKRRGKQVGVISNWDVRLEEVLRALGLWELFDCVVVSALVGAEKPAPAIFQHALRQCDCPPGRALHVGDSYEEDVLGARRAGLEALWLCRDGAADDPHVIRSLSEVLDRVP